MAKPCECINWCGDWLKNYCGKVISTAHHPNCKHYNDSLIDVWKVTIDGVSCYCLHEVDAREEAGDKAEDKGVLVKEKMHKEVFENLPEFEGF